MKTCTREYWCKSGHVSGHLTRIFPLFQNTESFYKDHAKVLQLRFHFSDHTSPIRQFKPHVPAVDFRSENIKKQFLPPWILPDSYLIWGRSLMN